MLLHMKKVSGELAGEKGGGQGWVEQGRTLLGGPFDAGKRREGEREAWSWNQV